MIDQMEFENYIEKMKKRKSEGDIKTAAKIADKVPWDEVEDVNVLMFAAGIYEEAECYKDAKSVIEYAYEIAPVKNRLYYALALINIKCKNLNDGINYYADFCREFPDDNRKLILKYYILRAKGAPYEQQKRVLSEYIKEEKDEKMTFELALLSDKLGEREDVLTCCNYIVDFYGVKKTGYGKNALLLKKKYVPLSESEEKLLENAEIGYIRDEDAEYEYKESPVLYNETRIEEDKINIPVEKVVRVTNIAEQRKIDEILNVHKDELDESAIDNKLQISYMPDEESYLDKEKNGMAFLNDKHEDKEKLKILINRLKAEEKALESKFNKFRLEGFKLGRRLNDMKLNEIKMNMIIESYSKDEGVEIAQKELNYIHDVLGEKVAIAKASAYNINEKGFAYYVDKIVNKDLIIENAGQLKNEVLDEIEEFIINRNGKTIFALVDVINNFDKVATDRPSFVGRFDVYSVLSNRPQETLDVSREEIEAYKAARDLEKVKPVENKQVEKKVEVKNEKVAAPKTPNPETPINQAKKGMNIDAFVEECKYYAKSIDCALPSDSIPALYEKAEELQDEHVPLTKENAAALIEEAADRAEKPKLFSKPKYDKDGCLILLEEHFQI